MHPGSREDADRIFAELSAGGTATMPIADQLGGDCFGSLVGRFGIHWMVESSPAGT